MGVTVQKPRTGCALHGGIQLVEALTGVVPILHANTGCGLQSYFQEKAYGRGNGRISGFEIPSTCLQERHIIFGGASRLREQIKNTIKVQKANLYVVLNSCEAAMVGDDIESMVEESVEQGHPVIATLSAGFQGDSHFGYETLMTDLLKKVPALPGIEKPDSSDNRPSVNIFGIIPSTDTFWQGDLDSVTEILESLGIRVNRFLESEDAVTDILNAAEADLSIVFSKWGVKPAEYLHEKYDIPVERFDSAPSGISGVENFVRKITAHLGTDETLVDDYIAENREHSLRYLRRIRDIFYEKNLNRPVVLVGDESGVTQAASVLHDYLRVQVRGVVLTDYDEDPDSVQGKDNAVLSSLTDNISFSTDVSEIYSKLNESGADVVLGSLIEKRYAEKNNLSFVEISEPVVNSIILNKSYSGYRGALTLTEDFINSIQN